MYNYVIYIIYAAIIFGLLIKLFATIYKKSDVNFSKYPENINKEGYKVMEATRSGKIKKQLLLNDSVIYNSNKALNEYVDFVDKSSVFKKIINMKESRFYE